jgi:hypothetical protein
MLLSVPDVAIDIVTVCEEDVVPTGSVGAVSWVWACPVAAIMKHKRVPARIVQ